MPIGIRVKKVKRDQRAAKENQPAQHAENQDIPQISAGGREIKKDELLKDQHRSSKEVPDLSTQRKFTTFINTLRINQFRAYLQISLEDLEIYDLKLNDSSVRIWVKRQLNAVQLRLFSQVQIK